MKINKNVYMMIALATLALTAVSPVFAETTNSTSEPTSNIKGGMVRGNKGMMGPAVVGTVTAISGNFITVSSKTTTTFTVDATNAKIMKNNVVGTVSSIVVGDTIMVQGTLTGTNVVATNIRDGIARGQDQNNGKGDQQIPALMMGNGLPIIAGAVTSVTGNSIVITNKSNVTYTIDGTSAKIVKGPTAATITNIAVGDQILVQGTINGNSVVATNIYDQTKLVNATTAPKAKGFFGRIGSFFGRMFGF